MDYHIALICDDGYAMPTAVTIQSIMDTIELNGNEAYIHVCSFGLSKENERKLKNIGNNKIHVCIDYFDYAEFEERIKSVSQKTHVTPVALIKFELSNYFSEINKLLYLDSDIIVNNDISELFTIDLSDYYLGASFEYLVHYNNLRFNPKAVNSEVFYFNSGVMIFNLSKMRENHIAEKLWDYKLNHTKTKLMDQECFNQVCNMQVNKLSIKWNCNPVIFDDIDINEINNVYSTSYDSGKSLLEDVAIIHYVGKLDKPWVYETARMQSIWQEKYDRCGWGVRLDLKKYAPPKNSTIRKIINKIKDQGFRGFFYFLKFRLKSYNSKDKGV